MFGSRCVSFPFDAKIRLLSLWDCERSSVRNSCDFDLSRSVSLPPSINLPHFCFGMVRLLRFAVLPKCWRVGLLGLSLFCWRKLCDADQLLCVFVCGS